MDIFQYFRETSNVHLPSCRPSNRCYSPSNTTWFGHFWPKNGATQTLLYSGFSGKIGKMEYLGRYWSAGPRRPPTKAMLLWLGSYICLYLYFCLVVGFRPRFHSVWSRPLCNSLVKKISRAQINILNCLPPLSALCVLKHVCTRLIILTGGKNNHKIKIAESGQVAVGSRQSASTRSTANTLFIISENADRLDCLYGEGGGV